MKRRCHLTPSAQSLLWLATLLLGWLGFHDHSQAATAHAGPQRIVSLCLPGDQLLLQLVARERILAVTFLAADPDISPHWREAQGVPATRGAAEELARLAPDLVLVGAYSTQGTAAFLKRLGVPTLEIGIPNDFSELREQIRTVAARLGTTERGEAIIAQMDARLKKVGSAASASASSPKRPSALLYFQDGYTPGAHSFANAILEAAGFSNVGATLSEANSASAPLERVIMERPQFLILTQYRESSPTATQVTERNPILRAAAHSMNIFAVPFRHFACPDASNVELVEMLHSHLDQLAPLVAGTAPLPNTRQP